MQIAKAAKHCGVSSVADADLEDEDVDNVEEEALLTQEGAAGSLSF